MEDNALEIELEGDEGAFFMCEAARLASTSQ